VAKRDLEQIGKPACVGFREKPFGTRSKQDPGEMNDDVDPFDGWRQRARIRKIRLDSNYLCGPDKIGWQHRPVIHQSELRSAGQQVSRQKASEIAGSACDQNRSRVH
jgi:hypothetical protein